MTTNSLSRGGRPAALRIRILLVDDHPALRAGLGSLLSTEADMVVGGEAASGEEAYSRYRALQPDVVIMDLAMEGAGGLEALRDILKFDPRARILVYSVHASEVMLDRALTLGALGYVTKGNDAAVLIAGIREVASRRGYVSPDLVHFVVSRQAHQGRVPLDRLSEREFQILLLLARGQTVAGCALALAMSEKTVRNNLTRIKAKLDVTDTAGLIRLAIRAGLAEA